MAARTWYSGPVGQYGGLNEPGHCQLFGSESKRGRGRTEKDQAMDQAKGHVGT